LGQYPDHRRAPVALYRQGEARLALGEASGCRILRDALDRYPSAREAAAAREALAARCQ
jgi:TolA-binding protein